MDSLELLGALASDKRLAILEWLTEPAEHFPAQRDGDLVADGVCVVSIAAKLGVSQPTATQHLQRLERARLVIATRQKGWTFYRRDEGAISAAAQAIGETLAAGRHVDHARRSDGAH